MTKKEFLKRLENELMSLSSPIRNDILNEYENHINEGIENGENEEAVVRSLGEPADIAEEILSVEETTAEPVQTEHVSMESNLQQDINPKEIDVIDIQGDFLTIDIKSGTQFEMSFESPVESSEFSHGVNGNQLIIKHKSRKANKIHFNILGFLRNRNYRNDKLTISWPENLSELKIRTEKGAVELDGLKANKYDVKTQLGSINSEDIIGVKGTFTSEMGSITVKESTFDDVRFSTDMGRLKVDDLAAKYQSYATDMGAIAIKNAHPEANIDAHTDMGAINVEYKQKPTSTQVIATTKMGSVANTLENYVVENPEYTARLTTSMGSVSVR